MYHTFYFIVRCYTYDLGTIIRIKHSVYYERHYLFFFLQFVLMCFYLISIGSTDSSMFRLVSFGLIQILIIELLVHGTLWALRRDRLCSYTSVEKVDVLAIDYWNFYFTIHAH